MIELHTLDSGKFETNSDSSGAFTGNSGEAGNTGVYRIVSASGDPIIDGLLSGVAWKFNNFSVNYPSSAFSYGNNYGAGEAASFFPFNSAQILVANFARELLKDYIEVTFVPGAENTANLRYANFQGQSSSNPNTHGYYPDGNPGMGDLWYSNANGDQGIGTIGSFAYATIFHEIGHTLGLKHGQDTGINGAVAKTGDGMTIPNYNPLPTEFDNWNYSLMTYRSYPGAQSDPVQGFKPSDNPVTFMMADIAALQYMYGANFSGPSSTDTYYQWDAAGNKYVNGSQFLPAATNGKIFETIWDSGGTDTYDTSNFSSNQNIDLRPGKFSVIQVEKLADLNENNPGTHLAFGNIANALQYKGDPRSLIENAITGSGNDIIFGNQAANSLSGLNGDDTLHGEGAADMLRGGNGNDTIDGGAQIDTAIFSGNKSAYTITNNADLSTTVSGPDGADKLMNVELLKFDDTTVQQPRGIGQNFNPATADPASFMPQIRDFDGNDLGAGGNWNRIGSADLEGDGNPEVLFVNPVIGRWASVGVAADGLVYMNNNNWGGDTRVVGNYIDPLIEAGQVVAGSDFDSQVRFARDLKLNNIATILGEGDYDKDGLQEIYFKVADGTAYLHAYMHADGNIQYANYQVQSQVEDFMKGNGVDASVYSGWFS